MTKLSDRYYTGREVQRKLAITEPALRNLVNQRKLRKVKPPGRKYGVYLREEVDTFAEKWFAFLTTQEPPKTTFEIATPEDMDGVFDLSSRAIGQTMSAEVRRNWLLKNPETCYIVRHANKIVAFSHLLPLKHETMMGFMSGKIRGWNITAEDVETFEPGKPLECLLIIASEPDVDETSRMHYVRVLLRGMTRSMNELGKNGITITKLYATSQTPTGIAMAIHAGMKEFGQRLGKRLAFVLDVETSQSFLLDSYKEGLAEWRKRSESKHKIAGKQQ